MLTEENYTNEKLIYLILFGKLSKGFDYSKTEWITNIEFYKSLETIIDMMAKNNFLDNKVINRINNIFFASRSIKNENYEERIEIINNILRTINCQKSDNSMMFYKAEYALRFDDKKVMSDKYYIDSNGINYIKNLIAFDYIVIEGQSTKTDNIEFFEKYLDEFLDNPDFYYSTLNIILKEFPNFFKNETFKNRTYCVLDSMCQYINDKEINKQAKKYKKTIESKIKA